MEQSLNKGELEHSMRDHRGPWEEQELGVLVVRRSMLTLPHKQIFYLDRTHKGQPLLGHWRLLEKRASMQFWLVGWLRMLAGAFFYRGRRGGMAG